MDALTTELRKIPPVTRFLCASSLAITIPVLMNILPPYKVVFVKELVIKRLEIWRLWSSFFLGSGGINYIFEFVMLYRTSEQLESGQYLRRSADYAYQLLVAGLSIIAVSTPLQPFIFTRPLLMCLTYLSSALAPLGAQTSLMGLVTFPVSYLPYVMIGLDLLMGGAGAAALSIAGAVVGHFWYWGIWNARQGASVAEGVLASWGRAPRWMKWLVGETGTLPPPADGVGASAGGVRVIPPRRNLPTGGNSPGAGGSTSGYNWGRGRSLGST